MRKIQIENTCRCQIQYTAKNEFILCIYNINALKKITMSEEPIINVVEIREKIKKKII